MSKHSNLVPLLIDAGYHVEPAVESPENTVVVSFPIAFDEGVRPIHQISMWEQLSLAAFLQKYWADNQVSITISFDPETEGPQIKHALDYFQYQLKGVSFLPRKPLGAYAQMPEEPISRERYEEMVAKIKPVPFVGTNEEAGPERFCDSERCMLV